MLRFFKCGNCYNILTVLNEKDSAKFCNSDKKLEEVFINTVDASKEKHIPCVEVNNNKVNVKVGSVIHPMTESHLIEWICLETNKGVYFKYLNASCEPIANFNLEEGEKAVAVYESCNLHGIWSYSL